MKKRLSIAMLLVPLALAALLAAPTAAFATGPFTIGGVVRDKATGAPVEGVYVLAKMGWQLMGSALTHADGAYSFSDLPAGDYYVNTMDSHGHYADLTFGDAADPSQPLRISADTSPTTIPYDLLLPVAPILSGHVQATEGYPLANATVSLLVLDKYGNASTATTFKTNGSGAYSGVIPAGDFVLRFDSPDSSVSSYYPNASSLLDAQLVHFDYDTTYTIDATVGAGVDWHPPRTTLPIGTWTGWHPAPITLSLDAYDDGVGVAHTYWQIGSGAVHEYAGPFTVNAEGVSQVNYWSVDRKGNAELPQTYTAMIDTQAPVFALSWIPSHWYRQPVSVCIHAADVSGYRSLWAWQNPGSPNGGFDIGSTIVVSAEGTTGINYGGQDLAYNYAYVESHVLIDYTPPVTSVVRARPYRLSPPSVLLELSAKDGASGVAATYYRVGAGPRRTYARSTVVPANVTVTYWSVDAAGNAETPHSLRTTVRSRLLR